jgi:uncharacterized protein
VASDIPLALRRPLEAFVDEVQQHFGNRLVEVRLFGSYARGEAHAESDVDIAIIVEDPLTHGERVWPMGLAGAFTLNYHLVISPIVLSKHEFTVMQRREEALALDLTKHGIVL